MTTSWHGLIHTTKITMKGTTSVVPTCCEVGHVPSSTPASRCASSRCFICSCCRISLSSRRSKACSSRLRARGWCMLRSLCPCCRLSVSCICRCCCPSFQSFSMCFLHLHQNRTKKGQLLLTETEHTVVLCILNWQLNYLSFPQFFSFLSKKCLCFFVPIWILLTRTFVVSLGLTKSTSDLNAMLA